MDTVQHFEGNLDSQEIKDISFSPDGSQYLVLYGQDIQIWESSHHKLLTEHHYTLSDPEESSFQRAVFGPENNVYVASFGGAISSSTRTEDLVDVPEWMGYCWDMSVLSSSNIAVLYEQGAFSFSHDGTLRSTHILPPGENYCRCGSISPCGILAYTTGDSRSDIQIVDMESGDLQVIETSYRYVCDVKITPKGDRVFGSAKNNEGFTGIYIWDINTRTQLKTILISYLDTDNIGLPNWYWGGMSISPDSKSIGLLETNKKDEYLEGSTPRMWAVETMSPFRDFPFDFGAQGIAFAPSEKIITWRDYSFTVWDLSRSEIGSTDAPQTHHPRTREEKLSRHLGLPSGYKLEHVNRQNYWIVDSQDRKLLYLPGHIWRDTVGPPDCSHFMSPRKSKWDWTRLSRVNREEGM